MVVLQRSLLVFKPLLVPLMHHHRAHLLPHHFAALPVNSGENKPLLCPNHGQMGSQQVSYFFQSRIHPKIYLCLPEVKN